MQGSPEKAIIRFKSALTYLRSYLRMENRVSDDNVTQSQSFLLPLPMKSLLNSIAAFYLTCGGDDRRRRAAAQEEEEESGHLFVFSHAIPLVPEHHFSKNMTDNSKICTAVVVFNLALTLHLRGLADSMSGRRSSLRCLQNAKSLYLHTLQLIAPTMNKHYQDKSSTNNVAFDLLAVALLNNTALIHLDLFEFAESAIAFERLVQYFTTISSFQSKIGGRRREEFPITSAHQEENLQVLQDFSVNDHNDDEHDVLMKKVDGMFLNAALRKLILTSAAAAA